MDQPLDGPLDLKSARVQVRGLCIVLLLGYAHTICTGLTPSSGSDPFDAMPWASTMWGVIGTAIVIGVASWRSWARVGAIGMISVHLLFIIGALLLHAGPLAPSVLVLAVGRAAVGCYGVDLLSSDAARALFEGRGRAG